MSSQAPNTDRQGTQQQGLQQAHFIQRKLKGLYDKTYKYLAPRKELVEKFENVLIWKETMVSAALYISIHWIFIVFAQTNYSFATRTGNLLFWAVAADVLWRAATNQFGSGRGNEIQLFVRSRKTKKVSFESAVIKRSTSLKVKELPTFEVICLWIAETLMWLDNLFIALRHWSVNDPYLFFACLLCPGLFLSLLGKYMPTMVIVYIAVIAVLTWPYIEYYDMRTKLILYIQARYPQALDKVKMIWKMVKRFASKDRTEFLEVALHSKGDEGHAKQALLEAFEQVTSSTASRPSTTATTVIEPRPPLKDEAPDVLPGMSLVQDSLLGLHPNAFQDDSEESLGCGSTISLGPGDMGEFPSISNLDEPIHVLPPSSRVRNYDRELPKMPSINEEDDSMVLPERMNSRDLDPFTDSIEVEYGGYNFIDGRSHPQAARLPRLPTSDYVQRNVPPLDLIMEEPVDVLGTSQTGFDTGYETTERAHHHHQDDEYMHDGRGYGDTYFPPPNYQAAVDGTDGGTTAGTGRESFYGGVGVGGDEEALRNTSTPVETPDETELGGYWLRQRH